MKTKVISTLLADSSPAHARYGKSKPSAVPCSFIPAKQSTGSILRNHLNLQVEDNRIDRRTTLVSLGIISLAYLPAQKAASEVSGAIDTNFTTYSSPSQGYALSRPSTYEQVDKAGADVLFRNPERKGVTLGVTVLPVMISSLQQFGSLDAVGEKLLGAERAKESTLGVVMLDQSQRTSSFGVAYDFVYELNSTRGIKRIISTVAIVNSKLYIVNGNVPCGKQACGAEAASDVLLLQRAAQSLDVVVL